MKQVSFYFNRVLGISNMGINHRNYAIAVGNFSKKIWSPQFPIVLW